MASRFPKLKLNADVIVTWLDSGLGVDGLPGTGVTKLVFKTTHGRVTYLGKDPAIHKRLCKRFPGRCRCTYIEVTSCSFGEEDTGSSLSGIWYESIVEVR